MATVEVADALPTTVNEDQGLVHEVTSKGRIVEDTETEVLDRDASREMAEEVAKVCNRIKIVTELFCFSCLHLLAVCFRRRPLE